MTQEQAKKLAQKFIDEQRHILEEYGDSVVKSKCPQAIASLQGIFREIASRPSKELAKVASQGER